MMNTPHRIVKGLVFVAVLGFLAVGFGCYDHHHDHHDDRPVVIEHDHHDDHHDDHY